MKLGREECDVMLGSFLVMLRCDGLGILTFDELLRDCEWVRGDVEVCAKGDEVLSRKLEKINSLLHLNNLNYAKGVALKNNDSMLPIVMKRLGSEFGYVERRDVTSKGEKMEMVVMLPRGMDGV